MSELRRKKSRWGRGSMLRVKGKVDMAMLDLKTWSLVAVSCSRREVMQFVSVGEVEAVEEDIFVGAGVKVVGRCCAVVRMFGQKLVIRLSESGRPSTHRHDGSAKHACRALFWTQALTMPAMPVCSGFCSHEFELSKHRN